MLSEGIRLPVLSGTSLLPIFLRIFPDKGIFVGACFRFCPINKAMIRRYSSSQQPHKVNISFASGSIYILIVFVIPIYNILTEVKITKIALQDLLKKIFKNLLVYASLLGTVFFFIEITLPKILLDSLEGMSDAAMSLALVGPWQHTGDQQLPEKTHRDFSQ